MALIASVSSERSAWQRLPDGTHGPRIALVPDQVSSAGDEAVEVAQLAGLFLDPWQQFVLRHALGERSDGKWAAFEVGLVVPRQNGKGSIFEARELAGLFAFGERLLIHSAHEQLTSTEHFRRILNLIEGVPEFDQRVLKVTRGKGQEGIELRRGQRILFKTRTGGSARGLTGDFVALDEAMILPEAVTSALVPTMAARSIEGNPQLMYAGSAPDQQHNEHGVVLARLRERAQSGEPGLAYFEWSAPGESPQALDREDLEDEALWAQANPGLGIRISLEHVSKEVGALGHRGFAVERLGVGDWPVTDEAGGQVISLDQWDACADPESAPLDPVCFVYDVSPDRATAAIGVAGHRADGLPHVEVVEHRLGTDWVVDRLVGLTGRNRTSVVACDERSPAASLIADLKARGVEVKTVNANEHAQAFGRICDAVTHLRLRHRGTPALRTSLRSAKKRPLGEAFAWGRKLSGADITPLVAVTLALWALENVPEPSRTARVY